MDVSAYSGTTVSPVPPAVTPRPAPSAAKKPTPVPSLSAAVSVAPSPTPSAISADVARLPASIRYAPSLPPHEAVLGSPFDGSA